MITCLIFVVLTVTAHGMLPLPLPLVSPEGLIIPDSMKLDSEGGIVSPLLSALQHLPLATLPALTSASLLGALANQQRAGVTSPSQPVKLSEQKSEVEKSKVRINFVHFLGSVSFSSVEHIEVVKCVYY